MKKNVIYWIGVKNPDHMDKYGDYDYFQYSKNTWKYWCKKNDCTFLEFDTPVEDDLFRFRINWQKAIFAFDFLEKQGIEYDQVALVDSSFMIKWNTPNFFNLTEHKFVGWRDIDNLRWINDSINGYKSFFDDFVLDRTKYINSGFVIFNETHKEFFNSFKKLYYDNIDTFIDLQDNIVKKGNEQTPMNYWLQIQDIELKTDLPLPYKLTHLPRKDLFSHNWQLNEDKTPFFIKYGYNFSFNGIPKEQRNDIMRQTWDMIKHNYNYDEMIYQDLLDGVNHKDKKKYTTSRKFKLDILKTFDKEQYKNYTILELGSCQGDTTKIYSTLFKKVYAVDLDEQNIVWAKEKCKDIKNIEFTKKDLYEGDWDFPQVDVVVIDAGHTYQHVLHDITRVSEYFNKPVIIIDDYGNPNVDINKAIDEKIQDGTLKLHSFIGEEPGFDTAAGWTMDDREGAIFNLEV